jgi:integrase
MDNIKLKSDGVYVIRFAYTDPLTGKLRRVKRHFKGTMHEAKKERDRLRTRANEGLLNAPVVDLDAITANALLKRWEEDRQSRRRKLAPSTQETSQLYLKLRILPAIGEWRVKSIQRHHLEEVITGWEKARRSDGKLYSAVTINNWIALLSQYVGFCFRQVKRDDLHTLRDLPRIEVEQQQRGRALTRAEAQRLLKHLEERHAMWHAFTLMALLTGQRWGSISALRWEDVSAEHVSFELSQYRGQVKAGNKTRKLIKLPMPAALWEALVTHKQVMQAEEHPNLSSGLVFPSRAAHGKRGAHMDSSALRNMLRRVCKALRIPTITPHDLRRTANSWMIEQGVSGSIVRAIMGHVSERMTDHYYHASQEAKQTAIQTITAQLKPPKAGPSQRPPGR